MLFKDMSNDAFVKKLRVYENDCPACENDTQDFCDNYCEYNSKRGDCLLGMMAAAADAIEKLTAEVEQWKQAWDTANKLYDESKVEIDRLKGELDRQMSICGK